MDVNNTYSKEVEFSAYCKKCKYSELDGWKDPCNDCLAVGGRIGTKVPEKFKPKDD